MSADDKPARTPGAEGASRSRTSEQADHHGEQSLRYSVLGDAAHELRSHSITDGEQKHQENCRLERLRWRCAPRDFDPDGVGDWPPPDGTIGQERGVGAVAFGLSLDKDWFNVYVAHRVAVA